MQAESNFPNVNDERRRNSFVDLYPTVAQGSLCFHHGFDPKEIDGTYDSRHPDCG